MSLESLLDHASRHHGLLHRADTEAHGIHRRTLDRLCDRAHLVPVANGVYRVRGSADTWHQRVLAGVLATGPQALASHRTAAALWGLPHARRSSVEVLVPRGIGAHHRLARQHETRHLTGHDVDLQDRIPVTSVERTVVDLAAVVPMGPLARLLDDVHELELSSFRRIDEFLDRMPTRGRRGVAVLRVLLEERIGTPKERKQPFEELLNGLITRSKLPPPVRQQRVDHDGQRFYVDFAWPEHRLAVECDGGGHATPAAHAYDLNRQNVIIEQGWNLRRFPWSEVRFHPDRVLATIRRALVDGGWSPPGK